MFDNLFMVSQSKQQLRSFQQDN